MRYDLLSLLLIIKSIKGKSFLNENVFDDLKNKFEQFKDVTGIQQEIINELGEIIGNIEEYSKKFLINANKNIEYTNELSEKLQLFLGYFENISQYNRVINYVIDTIHQTGQNLTELFHKFKKNSDSLNNMAKSVKQLALNTVIKSLKGQQGKNSIAIIAENITDSSDDIISIIENFDTDVKSYENFSQVIERFTNNVAKTNETIENNITRVNEIITTYNQFSKSIKNVVFKLKNFSYYIETHIKSLKKIRLSLIQMLMNLNENDKINSIKFQELFGLYTQLSYIINELNSIGDISKTFLNFKDFGTIKINYDFSKYNPYKIKNIFELYLNNLLFERLLQIKEGNVTPSVLKKWILLKTKKSLIITINDNFFFSDGSPITAEDVKFSFDNYIKNTKDEDFFIIEGATEFVAGKTQSVSGIKIMDKFSLHIDFDRLKPEFIFYLTKPQFIITKSELDKKNFKAITSGLYFSKENVLYPNHHHFLYNEFLEKIEFSTNNSNVNFNEEGSKFPCGTAYIALSKTLNEPVRKFLFKIFTDKLGLIDMVNYRKIKKETKDIEKPELPSTISVYMESENKGVERVIRNFCKNNGIKCTISKRKRKHFDILFSTYHIYQSFAETLLNIMKLSDNVFKAKQKMAGIDNIYSLESDLIDNFYLIPFEIINNQYNHDPNISVSLNPQKGIIDIHHINEQELDENDPKITHLVKSFEYFTKNFNQLTLKIEGDIDQFKSRFKNDYASLLLEYDFFQSGIEEFTNILNEIKNLEKIMNPIKKLNFTTIEMDQTVFNNLKLNLGSFLNNILFYGNFLENFKKKTKSIFEILKKINNISYFSAMEAEKSPDIKEDIQGIISEIRAIIKSNTTFNLEINTLLEESLLVVRNLVSSINLSMENLDNISVVLESISDIDNSLKNNRDNIIKNFDEIYGHLSNIENFSQISLGKVNELYSLYKEDENYFVNAIKDFSILKIYFNEFYSALKNKTIVPKGQILPDIKYKDIRQLNLYFTNLPLTNNPHFATDNTTVKFVNFIHKSIFSIDNNLNLIPELIESWDIKEKGLKAEFTLKPNLHFSNGKLLTTRDVLFTFESIFHPEHHSPNMHLFSNIRGSLDYANGKSKFIEGIEIIDDRKFAFYFNKIYLPFYFNIGTVYSSIIWHGNNYNEKDEQIGIGNYIVDKIDEKEIILKKNIYSTVSVNTFDTVKIQIINEDKEAEKLYLQNKIDILYPTANFLNGLKEGKKTAYGNINTIPQLDLRYLGINVQSRPELKLKDVRKAIFYALDRHKIIDVTQASTSIIAEGILPPGVSGHFKSNIYEYNLEKAKELLANVGLKNGIQTPLLLYFADNAIDRAKAELVKKSLEKIKINISLKPLSWKDFIQACTNGEIQLFFLGWIGDNGDPDSFLHSLFHSSNIGSTGNYFQYSNPDVDELLEKAMNSLNIKERIVFYNKAEEKIMDDAVIYVINHSLNYAIVNKNLHGFKLHPLDFIDPQNWWKF